MSTRFLRKKAVSERYDVTVRSVERMVEDGRLPPPVYRGEDACRCGARPTSTKVTVRQHFYPAHQSVTPRVESNGSRRGASLKKEELRSGPSHEGSPPSWKRRAEVGKAGN